MTALLLDPAVDGVLAGAGDPPGADERGRARGADVARRRGRRPAAGPPRDPGRGPWPKASARSATRPRAMARRSSRPPRTRAPPGRRCASSSPSWPPRPTMRDARIGAATASLAELLDRRIEVVEIGFDGGLRARSDARAARARRPATDVAIVPEARLVPADPDDAAVDRVLGWVTMTTDRHRLRDRMRELRIAPWSDATGDGMAFRLAALRAALGRLAEATPGVRRRPAARPRDRRRRRLVDDDARLDRPRHQRRPASPRRDGVRAGPRPAAGRARLDPRRRTSGGRVLADMVDDLLAPIGTVVTPAGLRDRPERRERRRPRRVGAAPAVDLHPGGLAGGRAARRARRRSPSSTSATASGSAFAAGISRSRSPAGWPG